MKTALELPDALFRESKALASSRGLSLRQFVIEALAQKLRSDQALPEIKPWLRAFRGLSSDPEIIRELRRLKRKVDAEFEQVSSEDWK